MSDPHADIDREDGYAAWAEEEARAAAHWEAAEEARLCDECGRQMGEHEVSDWDEETDRGIVVCVAYLCPEGDAA